MANNNRKDYGKKDTKKPVSKSKAKPYTKGKDVEVETSSIGGNSPEWYIPDPMVMEQATRVSFDDFIGVPIDFDPTDSIELTKSTLKPGAIMQVFMNPSPGYIGTVGMGNDPKSAAINQQGFRTYARLSSINAKNTNYLPNDVTTMILAMGELISMVALAQRAYGLLWTYNVRNRTMPTLLLDAAGVDAAKLRATAAPFLIRLNTLLVEANKIPFPSSIDYFKKCNELFSSVYRDSNSDMCELYVTLPHSTWELSEDVLVEGSFLHTNVLFEGAYAPLDPEDLLDLIEDKIVSMLTSATYNYVYSDIINLATKDASVKLLQFVPIDFNYAVQPVVDPEWLLKINNATILGFPLDTADHKEPDTYTALNDVLPDVTTLSLIYAPQFRAMDPSLGLDKLINFNNDQPDMNERLMATRYFNAAPLDRADGEAVLPIVANAYYTTERGIAMSDHYITQIRVITDNVGVADYQRTSSGVIGAAGTEGSSILTRFSQHPYLYEFDIDVEDLLEVKGLLGDLDFFTNLEFSTINKVNKLALFALFDVKDVTKSR